MSMYSRLQNAREHKQIYIQFFIYKASVTVQIVSRPFREIKSLTPNLGATT